MSISNRLYDFLDRRNVRYDTLIHEPTQSSLATAGAAGVPAHQIAKAVMLEDHEGRHLMALLPATHKINLDRLGDDMSRSFHLLAQSKLYEMFVDCEQGAIPPMGDSYNIEMVFDDLLEDLHDIYMEGGDHSTLVHLERDEFRRLMSGHKHSRFSAQTVKVH